MATNNIINAPLPFAVGKGGTGFSAGILNSIPFFSATTTLSTNATLTYDGTSVTVSGGVANSITRLLTLQADRSYAPANDGLILAGLASNGTVGLHDYGAIVMGSNPVNGNGGASIFQLRVGGSSTSTTNNGLFLQATTTGTNSTTEIAFYTGASTKIAAFNSAGVLNLASLTASQLVFTDASKNLVSISMSGDANISGAGVLTISNNAITTGKINNNAVDLISKVSGILPIANGGTNINSYTLGDTLYASAATTLTKLAGNTTAVKQYLSQTGTGAISAAPVWSAIAGADVTGSALTRVNDTNISLTLGGTPNTALLRAASITAGWLGQLSVPRGGTGLSAGLSGGIPYFSSNTTMGFSSALGANQIVLGGGAGVAPFTNSGFSYDPTNGLATLSTATTAARWTIKTTSATVGNEAALFLDRGTLAGGYAQLHLLTNGVEDWSIGTLVNSQNITFQLNSPTSVPFTFTPTGSLTATGASAATVIRATTTLTGALNEGSFYARRGDLANGTAQLGLFTGATADWYLGTRAASSDFQLFGVSANTPLLRVSTTGNVTSPRSSAFSAHPSVALNATGTGNIYTLQFDTEYYDYNGNYTPATGNFTAPVNGVYQFSVDLLIAGILVSHTNMSCLLSVNGVTYGYFAGFNPSTVNSGNFITINASIPVKLNVGDVVNATLQIYGSAPVSITTSSSFSGFLIG